MIRAPLCPFYLIHYPALPACKGCEANINSYHTTNLSRTVGRTGRNSQAHSESVNKFCHYDVTTVTGKLHGKLNF